MRNYRRGLVRWLVGQGHLGRHVHEIGIAGAEDTTIWQHALSSDAIIITKDEDFADRTAITASGPTMVRLRIGNSTNRALLQWLEPRWGAVIQLLSDGNRLIEVR